MTPAYPRLHVNPHSRFPRDRPFNIGSSSEGFQESAALIYPVILRILGFKNAPPISREIDQP